MTVEKYSVKRGEYYLDFLRRTITLNFNVDDHANGCATRGVDEGQDPSYDLLYHLKPSTPDSDTELRDIARSQNGIANRTTPVGLGYRVYIAI